MAINNTSKHIRDQKPEGYDKKKPGEYNTTAFVASEIIGVCFCKSKEEVMADIIANQSQKLSIDR
jgi:hypothetical protein